MAIADIARIRALVAEAPRRTTLTVDDWGDFEVEQLAAGESLALQAMITKADGVINLDSATYLLTHTVVAPVLTAEDVALLWPHKDAGRGLLALLDQLVKALNLTAKTEGDAIEAAKAGFSVELGETE